MPPNTQGQITPGTLPVTQIHTNTAQEVIEITVDRLKLALIDHLGTVTKRHAWITPALTLLTIATTFVTAEFKKALGLEPATWAAIFVLLGVGSLVWLVTALAKRPQSQSIGDLVEKIKKQS